MSAIPLPAASVFCPEILWDNPSWIRFSQEVQLIHKDPSQAPPVAPCPSAAWLRVAARTVAVAVAVAGLKDCEGAGSCKIHGVRRWVLQVLNAKPTLRKNAEMLLELGNIQ